MRIIDPTCGSGHFLLGAFERLFDHWMEREPATGYRELAQRALNAIYGVDAYLFAIAITRFRLLAAALRAGGERRLEDLPSFRTNLAVGDSLLHGVAAGRLLSGMTGVSDAVRHHYETEDAEALERILRVDGYHAVVGNPPYITVRDGALNHAYRGLYDSCHRQYSLAVPFMERFFQLAIRGNGEQPAGFVGMITANSFMKREFGTKVIEEFLPRVDLTHVIDTSGAYIPGHATPTVILLGRDRAPLAHTVRAVLGIRGEPGRPDNPAAGLVWSSVRDLFDNPGAENDFISIADVDRERFARHPWSLQGAAAPGIILTIDASTKKRLRDVLLLVGRTCHTGRDECYSAPPGTWARRGAGNERIVPLIEGTAVRDFVIHRSAESLFPYDKTYKADLDRTSGRLLWPHRTHLMERREPGGTHEEIGLTWFEWSRWHPERFVMPLGIAFAEVATHNHFALDRGGNVFRQTAPVIQLPEGEEEGAYLVLLGLLNSSVGEFWVKQNVQAKAGSGIGRGIQPESWMDRYQRDSTKLRQFPLPACGPLEVARELDRVAQQLSAVMPAAVARRDPPTRTALDSAAGAATVLRGRMVALQEELDWQCYLLYGLLRDDLTFDLNRLPVIGKGQRAFEIALARRIAAGEVTSTWFERHSSTPMTDVPANWPEDYRVLVQQRLDMIDADRRIRLLERPEYKRRWNWDELAELEREAQRTWLLDRIEALSSAGSSEPAVTTCARLADALAEHADAVEVARDLGGAGADLVALVSELVTSAAVPYLAAWRLTDSGLRTRVAWERTWDLQRTEDALEARMQLRENDPLYLSEDEHAVARKEAAVDRMPAPPKYGKADFRTTTAWNLRGKLDVPKERFVLYPATRAGADASLVVGWAGWDHLQQARALAGHYATRKDAGAEAGELLPLLAGVAELVPWLLQWHDDPDPVFGERMGQFFSAFVATEAAALGVTRADLAGWRPPATARGRRKAAR